MSIFGAGRRKQIVVDRPYQVRTAIIGIVYILGVAVCVSIPLMQSMQSTSMLLDGRSAELVDLYRSQQSYTIISLSVFFLGIALAWTWFTLWRTHKVAGPVVKLTRFIHSVSAGQLAERVQLRSGDELQALADALNDMAESLQERDRILRGRIEQTIEEAKHAMAAGPSPETVDKLRHDVDACFEGMALSEAPSEPAESKPEDLVYS